MQAQIPVHNDEMDSFDIKKNMQNSERRKN